MFSLLKKTGKLQLTPLVYVVKGLVISQNARFCKNHIKDNVLKTNVIDLIEVGSDHIRSHSNQTLIFYSVYTVCNRKKKLGRAIATARTTLMKSFVSKFVGINHFFREVLVSKHTT